MLIFKEDFFKAETRDDFYIEPMMKCAWAAGLEVLEVIRQICARHNIRYYAAYGTLLGAIRHKGFIPWDDDIDIMMFREDYHRFLSVAPAECPEGYHLYTPYNTAEHRTAFSFLANATSVSYSPTRLQAFHGFPYIVGVDIMPLDTVPDDPAERETLYQLFNIVISSMLKCEKQMEEVLESLPDIEELCRTKIDRGGNIHQQLCLLSDRLSQCYDDSESPYISCVVQSNPSKRTFARDWYSDHRWMPFENVQVPVPVGYEQILTTQYNDYMTPVYGAVDHEYPFYKAQIAKVQDIITERIRNGQSPFDITD
ncbi:MAG: LicD family protein [Blautia sp.]|nr:LicD family protein [Blautia sp.]